MAFGRKRTPPEEPFVPTDDSHDKPITKPIVKKKASEIALEKATANMNSSFAKLMERIDGINENLGHQTKALEALAKIKTAGERPPADEPPADEPPVDEPPVDEPEK